MTRIDGRSSESGFSRLEAYPSLRLCGLRANLTSDRATEEIPRLWQRFWSLQATIPGLIETTVSYGFEQFIVGFRKTPFFTYTASAALIDLKGPLNDPLVEVIVPPTTYAIFRHLGPIHEVRQTFSQAYYRWLPELGLAPSAPFDLERYDYRFKGNKPDSLLEILIPVDEKTGLRQWW